MTNEVIQDDQRVEYIPRRSMVSHNVHNDIVHIINLTIL